MLGLCCNARGCWPLPSEALELGLLGGPYVRTIVYAFDELDKALQTLPTNVKVCALLRKECQEVGPNYEHWDSAVATFAQRFKGRVQAVEVDNEADLNGDPPAHSVDLLLRAKGALLSAGMRPILTSVAGAGWQDYLTRCRALLGIDALGCWAAFHPYGSRIEDWPNPTWGFGELTAQIRRAHELIGLPIAVTEFGVKVGDIGGEANHAAFVTRAGAALATLPPDVLAFACLFCLGDEMGSPGEQGQDGFGLRRLDGTHRPAWQAFAEANVGAVPPPISPPENRPHYVLGFAEFAAAEPALVGEPLEDERGGVPAFSQQRTSRGILTAAKLEGQGWRLLFWEDATGSRYLFDGQRAERIA